MYSIYDNRITDEQYNFGELKGNLIFGFMNRNNLSNPILDPRIGTFKLLT